MRIGRPVLSDVVDSSASSAIPRVSHPIASGGAGTITEYKIAVIALVALLTGDQVPGLGAPVARVNFQQGHLSRPIDDVGVSGFANGSEVSIDFQSKRRIRLTKSDENFVDFLSAAIRTFRSDPDGVIHRRHRIGLVAREHHGPLQVLRSITELARGHSDSTSFVKVIGSPAFGATERQRYSRFRETLCEALRSIDGVAPNDEQLDELSWIIASSLEIWIADVEPGGRDLLSAVNRLGDLVGPGEGERLRLTLLDLAQSWGPLAGSVDLGMLRAELDRRGVAVGVPRHGRESFESLQRATDLALRNVRVSIGPLEVNRNSLVERLSLSMTTQDCTLVSGKPGSGKSVIVRHAIESARNAGVVVAVVALRAGVRLDDVNQLIGSPLRDALAAAPTGVPRVLFIDGVEQALSDGANTLRSLLDLLPEAGLGPHWRLVAVTRTEAYPTIEELLKSKFQEVEPIFVGDFDDGEVELVLEAFPFLRPLARHRRPERLLLRRPYIVDLLVRVGGNFSRLLGEEDVLRLVFERLVRMNGMQVQGHGNPADRADAYLALADASINASLPSRLEGLSGESRDGLVLDDIFLRTNTSYEFSHDVLSDYAVTTRLLESVGPDILNGVFEPRRLLRSVQLLFQVRLTDSMEDAANLPNVFDAVRHAAEGIEVRDGPRWRSVPYEALLNTGAAPELLRALIPTFLENDGEKLEVLLGVAARNSRPYRGLIAHDEIDVSMIESVAELLAALGTQLPTRLIGSGIELLYEYLSALFDADDEAITYAPWREGLDVTLLNWGQNYHDRHEKALACALLLGPMLAPDSKDAILALAHDSPERMGDVVENPAVAKNLARWSPDLLLALSGCYYLDVQLDREPDGDIALSGRSYRGRRSWNGDTEDGIRDHVPQSFLFGSGNGPFTSLLSADPARGMRLVGQVVDVATRSRIRVESNWGPSEISLEIETPGGLIREYRGTADVWNWYRATTVGAYPAMSSLMALRQWALSEITHRSVDSVVGEIMACGTSLAFASVAYSVAIENLEDARQIIYSYFRHPLIWHLEIGRVVHENSPLAPPLSEGSFLRHLPEQIAALLMLTGDSAARNEMKVVGDDLMLRHRELLLEPTSAGQAEGAVSEAVLLTTRWASSLDFERYQFSETDDDHSIVTIGVPDDVRIGLEQSGGEEAQLWLELHALSFLVCSQRDAFANSDFSVEAAQSAVERIGELSTLLEGRPGGQRPWIEEAATGAAAVVVLQAAAGREVGDEELQRSSRRLMELSLTLESMSDSYDNVDSQAWIFGSDRSMAAAIPSLLSPRLRERTGHSLDEVRQSLTVIASSPFFEVLERLCKALANQWSELPSVNSAREVIVEVLYEVVATSGLGPWINNERHRIRLLDPIGDITRSNEHNLNLTRARYAISSLEAIADSGQQYCDRASDLLNALVIHDRAVWPEHISNHDYIYVDGWRKDIDSVIAERAAKWNAHDLFAHVSAFISVPHDLVGLLTELNSKSDTLDRANAVHDVWPTLLDQLLPKARSANGETRNRHRRSSSLEELDRALLLAPIEHVEWPWNRTFALMRRWIASFQDSPQVADRLMVVLAGLGHLYTASGTTVVLGVLGDDVARISRDATLVAYWLQGVLVEHREAITDERVLLELLDRLALNGHAAAMRLQQRLEL